MAAPDRRLRRNARAGVGYFPRLLLYYRVLLGELRLSLLVAADPAVDAFLRFVTADVRALRSSASILSNDTPWVSSSRLTMSDADTDTDTDTDADADADADADDATAARPVAVAVPTARMTLAARRVNAPAIEVTR